MDLEKLNTSYEIAKRNLESKKRIIENKEKDIKEKIDDITIAQGQKVVAQRQNDVSKLKELEKEIQLKKQQIEKLKKSIEEIKEEVEMFQERIDRVVQEIRENPEMKQHIEQVLAKRYTRDIRDINKSRKEIEKKIEEQKKKKEETEKKIESIETVQKMIKEHPSMKNHLQGMLNANHRIKIANDKLTKLDPIKDKSEIDKIKESIKEEEKRLNKNKDAILLYASKKKLKITKEILEDIMKNSVVDKKTNSVKIRRHIKKH